MEIWTVTYWNDGEEPIITSFDNEENAQKCYKYFSKSHKCCIDKHKVYSTFSEK